MMARHFSERHLAERHFAERQFADGQFDERIFHRQRHMQLSESTPFAFGKLSFAKMSGYCLQWMLWYYKVFISFIGKKTFKLSDLNNGTNFIGLMY